MSLAVFQRLAFATIDDVLARDRMPFLTGGTPLYINAIIENWRIPEVAPDPVFREAIALEIERVGLEPVVERLRAVDPIAAEQKYRQSAQNHPGAGNLEGNGQDHVRTGRQRIPTETAHWNWD